MLGYLIYFLVVFACEFAACVWFGARPLLKSTSPALSSREELHHRLEEIRGKQAMEASILYQGYQIAVVSLSVLGGVLLGVLTLKSAWRRLLGFSFVRARSGALLFILALTAGFFLGMGPLFLAQLFVSFVWP